MALHQVQVLEWNRTRDYFPALVAAVTLNAGRTKQSDRVFEPNDFLLSRYPKERQLVTHDPDRGALGNWQHLKGALKGRTKVESKKRAALKPHHG